LIDALVLDRSDQSLSRPIEELGIRPVVTDTVMHDHRMQTCLARSVIETARSLRARVKR
jgi:hypothetical protein